uniref:Putative homing endonuclease n=1 Tax=viral metagenome TaxID=1070528 RepID=A0A6M3LK79_9ZZZZ
MNKGLGPKILELRKQGKSYKQISKELDCSTSIVCYHSGKGQKEKYKKRYKKYKLSHPYIPKMIHFINANKALKNKQKTKYKNIRQILRHKIYDFFKNRKTKMSNQSTFTVEDIIDKFSNNPICYLTGRQIDTSRSRSYHFDHMLPVSKGGKNTLDNLGICIKEANMAKNDMTVVEFLELCKDVLEYNGYGVTKSK